MNRSEEDYIKTIYELQINNNVELVKNVDIAESMGFTDQSVNEMIKKLALKDLVEFIPYKGVKLTELGNKQAIRLIRAHRVWEVFLMEHLNYSWQEVHEQAEFLEHSGNDELIDRLFNYLGKPKYCGHGNPIPTYDGLITNIYTKSLFDTSINEEFILKRVLDNVDLLKYLDHENISINDTLLVTYKDNFSGYIKIINKLTNTEYIITNKISKMLFG